MTTDLARHIATTKVIDTHEHLRKEHNWVDDGPGDVFADLFGNYVPADFVTAELGGVSVDALLDAKNPDLEARWRGAERAWQALRFTGYGEAVRILAKAVYNIDEISPQAARSAQPKLDAMRKPGERLRILRDLANLDHVQTDDFIVACPPDESGPEFFLYDLSWVKFASGLGKSEKDSQAALSESGVDVKNLQTLRQAMERLFERHGACAIAVKSQHAYSRTLRWEQRTDADAERALQQVLADPEGCDDEANLCLGDWCLARGVELSIQYNLPFKIHCGHYAGNRRMVTDRINAGNLCPLLIAYPDAKFVLMHIAYPYENELISITKHFHNVWADLCWAWSINPRASADFVRRFLHAAPINKLFGFGGDTVWPTSAYAYSLQMRKWLTRALQAEVDEGDLTEREAIDVASRLLHTNQLECFDVRGTRDAIRQAMEEKVCPTT